MRATEDQIQHKIEVYGRAIDRALDSIDADSVPPDNIPKSYRIIGGNSRSIGLYELSLGDCSEAATDLTTASEWYREAIEEFRARRETPADNFEGETTLLDYLYCALLCGDEAILTEAAHLVRKVEPEHYDRFDTQWRYAYTQALAASILDTGDQQSFLDDLEATVPDHDASHETFFTALWIALSGIEDRDEDRFVEGIEQFLEWHDGQVDFESKTSAEDLVCKQAAALIVLARREGMDIRVDSEYVPECVYELG